MPESQQPLKVKREENVSQGDSAGAASEVRTKPGVSCKLREEGASKKSTLNAAGSLNNMRSEEQPLNQAQNSHRIKVIGKRTRGNKQFGIS